MALTLEQVDAIRDAVRGWRRAPGTPGPPPDGQLEQIIEVMLGTSARIGEVLAIRKCDVDVTVSPATVRICGTIVSPAGKPTYRQPHPKTQKSTRVVSVPSFAAEVIRQRLVVVGPEAPDHLLFFTRNGTPLTTNNIRRRLRAVLSEAGIDGRHPARLPPHGRDRSRPGQRAGPRCRTARSHLVEDHQGALHPARRGSRSGDGRDPGVAGPEASRRSSRERRHRGTDTSSES